MQGSVLLPITLIVINRLNTVSMELDKLTFLKDFIYLFLHSWEGREKKRERNINVWLPLTCPILGTSPATQACTLIRNQTRNPLILRPALNPLSYTRQGDKLVFKIYMEVQRIENCYRTFEKLEDFPYIIT